MSDELIIIVEIALGRISRCSNGSSAKSAADHMALQSDRTVHRG